MCVKNRKFGTNQLILLLINDYNLLRSFDRLNIKYFNVFKIKVSLLALYFKSRQTNRPLMNFHIH